MPRTRIVSNAMFNHVLYLNETQHKSAIDGMMSLGFDHAEAVETLQVGMRQANCHPVPQRPALNRSALPAMY